MFNTTNQTRLFFGLYYLFYAICFWFLFKSPNSYDERIYFFIFGLLCTVWCYYFGFIFIKILTPLYLYFSCSLSHVLAILLLPGRDIQNIFKSLKFPYLSFLVFVSFCFLIFPINFMIIIQQVYKRQVNTSSLQNCNIRKKMEDK